MGYGKYAKHHVHVHVHIHHSHRKHMRRKAHRGHKTYAKRLHQTANYLG